MKIFKQFIVTKEIKIYGFAKAESTSYLEEHLSAVHQFQYHKQDYAVACSQQHRIQLLCNITQSLYSCRHCLDASNSGMGGLAFHARTSTLKRTAQTSPILIPHLPLTTTVAHTVPVSFGFTIVRNKVRETYHCNGNV